MPSESSEPPPAGPVQAWRLLAVPRAVALVGVLGLVSLAASFLLSPGLSARQVPDLGEEDLGRPFRASSLAGFKASRDFEVADEARTLSRREEARARVRHVFDYDPTVESGVKRAVRDAFGAMQEVVAAHLKAKAGAVEPAPVRKAGKDGHEGREDLELSAKLRAERRHFDSEVSVPDDDDFEVLVQSRFAHDVEQAVMTLVEVAYRARVVVSRDELSRIDVNGITVRVLGGTTEYEMTHPGARRCSTCARRRWRWSASPRCRATCCPRRPPLLRRAVLRLAKRQVRANLTVNIAETEARRRAASEAVKPVMLTLKKGQRIIGDGELVNEQHLLVMRSVRAQTGQLDAMQVQLGGFGHGGAAGGGGLALLLGGAAPASAPPRRDALFMGLLAIGAAGAAAPLGAGGRRDARPLPLRCRSRRCTSPSRWRRGAMLVRFVLSESNALFFTIIFSALAGRAAGQLAVASRSSPW